MCHLCVLDLELLPSRLRIAAVLRGSCMGRAGVGGAETAREGHTPAFQNYLWPPPRTALPSEPWV